MLFVVHTTLNFFYLILSYLIWTNDGLLHWRIYASLAGPHWLNGIWLPSRNASPSPYLFVFDFVSDKMVVELLLGQLHATPTYTMYWMDWVWPYNIPQSMEAKREQKTQTEPFTGLWRGLWINLWYYDCLKEKSLSQCPLMTQYRVMELSQHWFREWRAAWRYQANIWNSWTNIDLSSVKSSDRHNFTGHDQDINHLNVFENYAFL